MSHDRELSRLQLEATSITREEADAFAAKLAAWTEKLTDHERRILGTAIAVTAGRSSGIPQASLPSVGPITAAMLTGVAAVIASLDEIDTTDLEREAGARERHEGPTDQEVPDERMGKFGVGEADRSPNQD